MKTVLFHRDFKRFQGGHLKVFHYFTYVRSSPSYEARIRFSADSRWDESNPWGSLPDAVLGPLESVNADIQFLAGTDWRALAPAQRAGSSIPIVNLIQDFRPTRPNSALREFTAHPAIRICIGPEIHEALLSTHAVRGPIFTVPIGIDLDSLPAPLPAHERDIDCVVLAVKDAELGATIARRLTKARRRVLLVDSALPRPQLLGSIARARVAALLPASIEGAYMPALESMALGALVVCPDCTGNRSFCRDGETCIVPERRGREMADAALTALAASPEELAPMLAAAREESARHSLAHERTGFLEILDGAEALWAEV